MTLFLSTVVNKIDKKGRVSVPSHFRNSLEKQSFNGVVLFKSLHADALEGCRIERLQDLSNHHNTLDFSTTPTQSLAALIFAEAQMIPFDSEGRILVPRSLLDQVNIHEEIAFVGRGQFFELWHPAHLQKFQADLRAKLGVK